MKSNNSLRRGNPINTFLLLGITTAVLSIFSQSYAQNPGTATGYWSLTSTTPYQEIGENPAYPKTGSISSGSCVGKVSWRDNDAAYGSFTYTFQWTPPPATLKPNEEFSIGGSITIQVSQAGGGRYIGGVLSATSQASGINNHPTIAETPGGWHSSQGSPPAAKGTVKFVAPSPGFGKSFWLEVSPFWGEHSRVTYVYTLVQGAEPPDKQTVSVQEVPVAVNETKPPSMISLKLTYPLGESPKVFDKGWKFGASCIINDGTGDEKDISNTVEWSGTATFSPSIGAQSSPVFNTVGANIIKLKAKGPDGEWIEKEFSVTTVASKDYAHKGSIAMCTADSHGEHDCPACPHTVFGPLQRCASDVLINGSPAARKGDVGSSIGCCVGLQEFTIIEGDPQVLIHGIPAAKYGSKTQHCGGVGALVKTGGLFQKQIQVKK